MKLLLSSLVLLLCTASALSADPFEWHKGLSRLIAQDADEASSIGPSGNGVVKSEQPNVDMEDLRTAVADFNRSLDASQKLPDAARAPYPYFHSSGEINTNERSIARPAWFDADYSYWYSDQESRANRGRLRGVVGIGSWTWDYTHVRSGDDDQGAQWFKGFLGMSLPMYSGYVDLALGASWLDDHDEFHNVVAFHSKVEASVYPIYPLGVVGGLDFGYFENGRYTIDWEVEAKLQVWRSVFVTVGWRDIATPGHHDSFRHDGVFFGLSLTFSNVRTIFDSPQGGPADGLFGLLD